MMRTKYQRFLRSAGWMAAVLFLAITVTYCGGGGGGLYGTPPTPTQPAAGATFQGAVSISTSLTGAQQVPPVSPAGTGSAVITVKPGTGELIGSVSFSGMSSATSGAHIHDAATGGIVVGFAGGTGGTSGTATIPAGTVLTSAQLSRLYAGGLYFNVHTANNAGGEIRGNIVFPTASITTTLSGSEEAPLVPTAADGTGTLTINLGTGAVSGAIAFSGLSSAATLAHIHQGAAGTNGGVLVTLTGGAGATSGTWSVPAGTVLGAADLNSLINDDLYFNIHTGTYPGGEIRGQIRYRESVTANLTGEQEVPLPADTIGTGSANLSVNPATGAISGTVDFTGLTSAALAAHIHQAAAGANGPVVVTLTGGAGATSGTWTAPVGTVLTMEQLNALKAGELYINIHTSTFPDGEIRGQLTSP